MKTRNQINNPNPKSASTSSSAPASDHTNTLAAPAPAPAAAPATSSTNAGTETASLTNPKMTTPDDRLLSRLRDRKNLNQPAEARTSPSSTSAGATAPSLASSGAQANGAGAPAPDSGAPVAPAGGPPVAGKQSPLSGQPANSNSPNSNNPTRASLRRSSARPSSLLASNYQSSNSNPSNTNGNSLLNSRKPSQQTEHTNHNRRDTHVGKPMPARASSPTSKGAPASSSSANRDNFETRSGGSPNKTANARNYSRDSQVPLPRPSNQSGSSTKLLRISLPDNAASRSSVSSNSSYSHSNNNNNNNNNNSANSYSGNNVNDSVVDKNNKYMFTQNGLKRFESQIYDADQSSATMDDSDREDAALLNLSMNNHSNQQPQHKRFHVLIGVTGSVATIKLLDLVRRIKSLFPLTYKSKSTGGPIEARVEIKIVMTRNSALFAPREELARNLKDPNIEIFDDEDEWSSWRQMGDPILHIELRKWADLCLIAPIDANTMAKLANGICDNLLSCVVRAWDMKKPLIYCPAMNVHMYSHPLTREHLCKLQSLGYSRVDCVEKRLACGDSGMGGMAPVDQIAQRVLDQLIEPGPRRAANMARPLLNQQPTYPIMSTPEADGNQSSSTGPRPIARSMAGQLDALRNQKRTSSFGNSSSALDMSMKRQKASLTLEQAIRQKFNMESTGNLTNGSSNVRMGTVTSLQNLRALASMEDGQPMDLAEDEMIDYVDDDDNDEASEPGFESPNMLEDGMILEEAAQLEPEAFIERMVNRRINLHNGRSSSLGSGSGGIGGNGVGLTPKSSGLGTPMFNTSRFLAHCFNEERNCFTCSICKNDYKNRKSMSRHLKEQHVQGSIYTCQPCGVAYKRREKLIKHQRERHPNSPTS